jgi:hypothetical protein
MHALLLTLAFLTSADPTPSEGVLPTGKDGKPLNLDFETGTLQDWTAAGDAFQDQPILGDTVAARRGDNKSKSPTPGAASSSAVGRTRLRPASKSSMWRRRT